MTSPIDVSRHSPRGDQFTRRLVTVANGQVFTALDMTAAEVLEAKGVLYMHVHRATARCYIGQSIKKCKYRWNGGDGYKSYHQPKLRAAIDAHGWDAFDSLILGFFDDQAAYFKPSWMMRRPCASRQLVATAARMCSTSHLVAAPRLTAAKPSQAST